MLEATAVFPHTQVVFEILDVIGFDLKLYRALLSVLQWQSLVVPR